MPSKRQIEAAAKAIHGYELENGYITHEWGAAGSEEIYMGMAKAALDAAAADFETMVREAQAAFMRLTPEQQAEHRRVQRKSWVIGEMMLEHPEVTRAEAERLFNQIGF